MDPRLSAMLRGELSSTKPVQKEVKEKTRLEKEMDKEIDAYLETMEFPEDPRSLESGKMKKESMRLKLKEEIKMPELSGLIDSAMRLLYTEGKQFFSIEIYEKLISDFNASGQKLAALGVKELADVNLQTVAGLSNQTMESIFDFGLESYKAEQYANSLALFTLLSLFNPGNADIWLRLGIAAEKSDKIDLALRSYAAALDLDPSNIGARLFSAECYLLRHHYEEAGKELMEAKILMKETKPDQVWVDFLASLENEIKTKR